MAHKAIVEKFPIVIQHDAMQCGIACMQMVCKFYGREYSQEYLSELCHATVEGVSLLAINETMGSLGFHTVCARAAVETLEKVPLPCILHWNQNHFVVLYEVRKGTVRLRGAECIAVCIFLPRTALAIARLVRSY